MSEDNSSREFRGEESLKEIDESIEENTYLQTDNSREFLGVESLKRSDEMNEDTMSEDDGKEEFFSEEEGRQGGEQARRLNRESFSGAYTDSYYALEDSGEEKFSENTSLTPLKQSWMNDMQLMSMYLDEKVSDSVDALQFLSLIDDIKNFKHEAVIRKKSYLASQPELEDLLSDYVTTILLVQPDDVISFTAQHFKAFADQPN